MELQVLSVVVFLPVVRTLRSIWFGCPNSGFCCPSSGRARICISNELLEVWSLLVWCYKPNVCVPISPNSFVEILIPTVMGIMRWGSLRSEGHESSALTKGISALRKEIAQSSLVPSTI